MLALTLADTRILLRSGSAGSEPYRFVLARFGSSRRDRDSRVGGRSLGYRWFIPVLLRVVRGARIDAGTATGAPAGLSDGLRTPWPNSQTGAKLNLISPSSPEAMGEHASM